jgi:hypothetical protein
MHRRQPDAGRYPGNYRSIRVVQYTFDKADRLSQLHDTGATHQHSWLCWGQELHIEIDGRRKGPGICRNQYRRSVRTVYRDIAHLQASGLPIEGEAGVGYLLRPGFDLSAMTFTFEQLDALAVGLSFVEVAGDRALSEAAHEVRAKIQASLPEPEKRKLENAPLFASRRDGHDGPNQNLQAYLHTRIFAVHRL